MLSEGFSHFVPSIAAPVVFGWSVCRVGLAPTGKRRLLTAHANNGLMHRSKRCAVFFSSPAPSTFAPARNALRRWTAVGGTLLAIPGRDKSERRKFFFVAMSQSGAPGS